MLPEALRGSAGGSKWGGGHTTDVGWLHILGTPAGTSGYDDLARTADVFDLFGQRVLVASVEDLIRMKRAAGRPKDLVAVEELGALRDELDRRRDPT
jgi:hypothetical protein